MAVFSINTLILAYLSLNWSSQIKL